MKKIYFLVILAGILVSSNNLFAQFAICSITISSGAGTDAQIVCVNNPILDITYDYAGGQATVPVVTGLPAGLTFSYDNNLNNCTISGTPTEAGTFNYSVGLTMASCINGNPHGTGTITVNPRPESTGVTICPGGTGNLLSPTDCTTTTTSGPKYPGSGFNADGDSPSFHTPVGTIPWDSPENIINNGPVADITLNPHDTSLFLAGNDCHFNIPGDAIIKGITVEITRICSFTGSPSVQDYAVLVFNNGPTTLGAYAGPPSNKAQTGVDWSNLGYQVATYGGPTDTWGRTWTPAQINGPNFGAALSVINANDSDPITVSVDYIKIAVTYTVPGLIKWYTVSAFGSPIGTGSLFNPVGVLNSGLPNTNTAGTTSFYAECNTYYNCRTQTDFVVKPLPNIVVQPVAVSKCTGETASFNVIALGTDLMYQWYKGTTMINAGTNPTAITSTLTLNNVQPGDADNYKVVVTSLECPVTSGQGTLTVNALPTASITNNGNNTACLNTTTSVTLTGSGGTLPYTFSYNITSPGNPNAPVQTITTASGNIDLPVQTGTEGSFNYNLIAVSDNNGCTNQISSGTTITVIQGPLLASPSTASVCSDSAFNYAVLSSPVNAGVSWTRILPAGVTSSLPGTGTGATINDVLHNDGYLPAIVQYVITLSGTACNATATLFLTVNPTPVINTIAHPDTLCNGFNTAAIIFSSNSPDSVITWTCAPASIGFGTSGNGSISSFVATNTSNLPVTVTVTVSIMAGSNQCPGADSSFTITVLPTPYLTSSRDTTVCNNTAFVYTATSSADAVNGITGFSWTRPAVLGISNGPGSGSSNIINEIIPLNNTTSEPVLIKYIFILSIGTGCNATDTLSVLVYPSATVNAVGDFIFCNAYPVDGIAFSSTTTGTSYTWSCSPSIGFGESGTGNIPPFFASSNTTVNANVSVTAVIGNCPGTVPTTFTITVNPSPPDPDFNWLALHDSICKGSSNINFNIISPESTVSYLWRTVPPNDAGIIIKDTTGENTVISFLNSGNKTIQAVATSSLGCTNSNSRIVKINSTEGIEERKIFKKQPGNLLIYPDNQMNSLNGYQWGYDSLLRTQPDTVYSPPLAIDGQVYQFFVPSDRFIINNELDTIHYAFWVLLQDGACYSKVYYNGPYSSGRMQYIPQEDNSGQLNLFPNPNNGIFDIVVKGDIYGTMEVSIYNSIGQVVFTNNFKKITHDANQKINLKNLPNGSYYLLLKSSDLKKLKAGFVIQK